MISFSNNSNRKNIFLIFQCFQIDQLETDSKIKLNKFNGNKSKVLLPKEFVPQHVSKAPRILLERIRRVFCVIVYNRNWNCREPVSVIKCYQSVFCSTNCAFFLSLNRWVIKGGSFKLWKFFNYPQSLLYCLCSKSVLFCLAHAVSKRNHAN